MTHRKILEKILIDRDIQKKDFAVQLGYGKNNYTSILNKPTYSEKMIKKIAEALGVEPTVFTIQATINHSGEGDAIQHIAASDRIAELESRLRDKEEIIEVLREKLRKYEYMDKRN